MSNIEGVQFVSEIQAGIIVEPENTENITLATLQLLNDSKLRKNMSNNGRIYIENNFTWHKSTVKILDICEQLIK